MTDVLVHQKAALTTESIPQNEKKSMGILRTSCPRFLGRNRSAGWGGGRKKQAQKSRNSFQSSNPGPSGGLLRAVRAGNRLGCRLRLSGQRASGAAGCGDPSECLERCCSRLSHFPHLRCLAGTNRDNAPELEFFAGGLQRLDHGVFLRTIHPASPVHA
jgi:hypothetical protein